LISPPTRPISVAARSNSAAAASGSCVANVAKAAESVGISAHRLGQVIVGAAGQIDSARDIGLVLHAGVEQRQNLEIDARAIHLLKSKRAAVARANRTFALVP
jgi:hypothetical protein